MSMKLNANFSSSNSSKAFTGPQLLPEDFCPSIHEFIIGRGRRVHEHCGNQWFRDYIDSLIPEYLGLENNTMRTSMKTAKTQIIYRVLHEMKLRSPLTGGFVKQDPKTQRWLAVGEATARITISQSFRDAHSSSYKSSKQFKQKRRQKYRFGSICSSVSTDSSVASVGSPELEPKNSLKQFGALLIDDVPITLSQNLNFLNAAPAVLSTNQEQNSHSNNPVLDLESLWSNLSVQNTSDDNPFEPTPIDPTTSTQQHPISSSALMTPVQVSGMGSQLLMNQQGAQQNTNAWETNSLHSALLRDHLSTQGSVPPSGYTNNNYSSHHNESNHLPFSLKDFDFHGPMGN